MANIDDFHMPRLSDREKRRAVRWLVGVLGAVVLLVMVLATLTPYVDYLWYSLDVRQPQVFTRGYEARALLFAPAFFFTWGLLHFSLRRAFRLSLVYLEGPSSAGQLLFSNALHFVQERGWGLVRIIAPVLAFLSATGFANEWNTYLLAANGGGFGLTDPIFGLDLGFFVFTLPWYRAIVNYVFGVLLLATVLTVAIYAGLQLVAAIARVELGRPNIRLHIAILAALTLLALAAQVYLKTYEYGLSEGSQFTGAGYAASVALPLQRIVAGLIAALAVFAAVLARSPRVYEALIKGGIAVIAVAVICLGIVPAFVQKMLVEPDKLSKERGFAARAIRMTRYAYRLDAISARDFPVQDKPGPEDLVSSKATLDNMRLWDPEIVRQSIEVLQGLKPYYTFSDVDVDRYQIGGKATEVMLAPRNVRLEGLSENARTWINERLQYTHGFGVVMCSVNSATADGDPTLMIRDIPPVSPSGIPLTESRIYYSDTRDDEGNPSDEYALVSSNQAEFDYPAQDKEEVNHWTGRGGIPIGGFFRRLALAASLSDGNLLVSGNVTASTRLLMHRSVTERCARLYPFLKLDADPYVVVLGGKVYWLLDGYTTTDRMPYSDAAVDGINYIRNSVKIVIDAYSGDTTAYAIDPAEPILKTYRRIYPGLVKDLSQIPDGLREHFRYPEDLFRLQAAELAQYHVTDPIAFLNNNDAWELPSERGLSGARALLAPYYVEMTLPGEDRDGFVLMLPFTPRSKPNMSGWLAAHCDPDRYGEMVLYNFAKGANVAGAEQMETTFSSDPKFNAARVQLQGGGGGDTELVIGNMLVIPIGKSVMYAESIFPKSRTSGLQARPRLKKVLLGLNGRMEVGDTYGEALDKLFGVQGPAPAPTTGQSVSPPLAPTATATAGVREALGLLDQAEAALRSGDFARYGDLQKKVRQRLRSLVSP